MHCSAQEVVSLHYFLWTAQLIKAKSGEKDGFASFFLVPLFTMLFRKAEYQWKIILLFRLFDLLLNQIKIDLFFSIIYFFFEKKNSRYRSLTREPQK